MTIGDISTWAAFATLLGGLAAFGYMRTAIAQLRESNTELRAELGDVERRATADRQHCNEELAELRGRLAAMTTAWAADVARGIANEWRRMRQEEGTS